MKVLQTNVLKKFFNSLRIQQKKKQSHIKKFGNSESQSM